LPTKPRQPDP